MFKTRMRKMWGDIVARKGRTILVVLSIAIGVFGASTLVGMNDLIVKQLREDLNPDVIAMTHAYVQHSGRQTSLEENQAFLDRLKADPSLPGIETIEGQAFYAVSWRPASAESDDSESEYERSFVLSYTAPLDQVQLEPISRVLEGRMPVEGVNEIVVEKRFTTTYDLGIGDQIVFLTPTEEGSAESEPWTIVGVVFQPIFTLGGVGANLNQIPVSDMIFAQFNDAQDIVEFDGLSSIYVRYTDVAVARGNLDALRIAVLNDAETNYAPGFAWVDNPDDSFIIGQVTQVTSVLNMLAIVSMIVSGFLVTNVINTIVVEQKRQIGVLKSLGASRFDNVVIYAGMAFIYGVMGGIIGVALSLPVTAIMSASLASLANTIIEGFVVSPVGVAIGFSLGILVPVIASLIPVINGTRVTILDAMSDVGISSNWGTTRLSRFIGSMPLPVNIRQALSNVAQKKWRLALTGVTLMLAIAAFMGVTAVFTALGDSIGDIFDKFNYEMVVVPQTVQNQEQMTALLQNIEGVEEVIPSFDTSVGVEGYSSTNPITEGSNQVQASGVAPDTDSVTFELIQGTGWSEDPDREGVIISSSLSDVLQKGDGDTLVINIIGRSYSYEIIGVDNFSFQDLIYFNWRDLATRAGFVDDEGNPIASSFAVDLVGDLESEPVDAMISSTRETLRQQGVEAEFVNQPALADEIAAQLNVFSLIFNMTSAVMALVGAIGLLATLSMAVFERQKEIGVMRSIGAGSGTIIVQFLVEGVLVGVIAWIVAIPLSYLLGSGLSGSLGFGSSFEFVYPPQVLLMGFVGITLVAAVASIWPSMNAARSTVSDILRYQ